MFYSLTLKRPKFQPQHHKEIKWSLGGWILRWTHQETGHVACDGTSSIPSLHNPVLTDEEVRSTEQASIRPKVTSFLPACLRHDIVPYWTWDLTKLYSHAYLCGAGITEHEAIVNLSTYRHLLYTRQQEFRKETVTGYWVPAPACDLVLQTPSCFYSFSQPSARQEPSSPFHWLMGRRPEGRKDEWTWLWMHLPSWQCVHSPCVR